MARLFSLAIIIGLIPSGLAGPACAQKHKTASDCMLACNTKWGFPGLMMGTDPWGTVMHLTGKTDDDWNGYLTKACGEESVKSSTPEPSTTYSTVAAAATKLIHQGLGTQSVSSTSVHSTTTSARPSSTFTTSTRRTTSSTSTTSTKAKTTTTSTSTTKAKPTTSTTTHTTAKATPTAGTTNSFTGGDSDSGDSDSSNKGGNSGNTNTNTNTNTGSSSNSNSGSSSGGNGSRASNADVQTYLNTHNSIRSKHGAVPVTWSNAAAEKAQQWADLCKNQHSGGTLGPLGENLAAGTGSFSITEAVKAWTDEVTDYNPNNPQPSHFTQVVWKATTQIGCAVQTCDGIFAGFGAAQYYVCEYSEQGNVIGNFGANVQA